MKHSLAMSSMVANAGPFPSRDAVMSRKMSSSTSFSLRILTALIGSPTYLGSLKRMVLTRPAPLRSRQGITRVVSMSATLREILQEPHPETVALLRVELNAHQVVVFEAGIEERGAV